MNMPRQHNRLLVLALAPVAALALANGCSSSGAGGNSDASGTGGTSSSGAGGQGTGGAAAGAGGAIASGAGGNRGTGGTIAGPGTGGASSSGVGGQGIGGASAGTGGRPGAGGAVGTAGASGTGGRTASDASASDGASADGGGATMSLTSTAFNEGGRFPAANTCTGSSHQSPELAWTPGPSATMSYAVILTDLTNGFVHWAIWDIPATTQMLPAVLPSGATLTAPVSARQVNRFGSYSYFGPCPSGTDHTYQFEVHAVDVAMLPVAATVPTTAAGIATVRTAILAHTLGHGDLSGVSNASM